MAGIDPISLAVIGAATGAIASPKDPIKGALLGGVAGFTGGSALAGAAGAAGTAGAAGIGVPTAAMGGGTGLIAPASMTATGAGLAPAAAGMGGGTGLIASTAPTVAGMGAQGITAANAASLGASAAGMSGMDAMRMAGRGMQMAQPQQQAPATGPNTFRGAKQVNTTEPILSLLATAEPRRRQPLSLL